MRGIKAKGILNGNVIVLQNSNKARELIKRGFGTVEGTQIYVSPHEALYLMERDWLDIYDINNKKIESEDFSRKIMRKNRDFLKEYIVFKDLKSRGYTVKTGAKYGTAFRVYDKGILPGEAHAKWLVVILKEDEKISWPDLLGKNRIANSTRKKTLLAIVDNDSSITYLELRWVKP